MKLFQKPETGVMPAKLALFAWVLIMNVVVISFHMEWWPMFFALLAFDLLGKNTADLPKIFCGGIVGILISYAFVVAAGAMAATGMSEALCKLIPLAGALLVLMIGSPLIPLLINDVAFLYFLVGLLIANIDITQMTLANVGEWIIMLVVGGAILIFGALKIGMAVLGHYMKKAMAAAAAAKKAE